MDYEFRRSLKTNYAVKVLLFACCLLFSGALTLASAIAWAGVSYGLGEYDHSTSGVALGCLALMLGHLGVLYFMCFGIRRTFGMMAALGFLDLVIAAGVQIRERLPAGIMIAWILPLPCISLNILMRIMLGERESARVSGSEPVKGFEVIVKEKETPTE